MQVRMFRAVSRNHASLISVHKKVQIPLDYEIISMTPPKEIIRKIHIWGLTKIFMSGIFNRHSIVSYRISHTWGFSSVGRAPALHAGGHRFDPDKLHHLSIRNCSAVLFLLSGFDFNVIINIFEEEFFIMLCIAYTPCKV